MNAKTTVAAIVLAAVSSVNAESVWTGAEDSFWTNANNWASGVVPGILDDENRWSEENLADNSGNTAVFSLNNVLFNIFIISAGAGNVKKS